jgi:hypothetical protein
MSVPPVSRTLPVDLLENVVLVGRGKWMSRRSPTVRAFRRLHGSIISSWPLPRSAVVSPSSRPHSAWRRFRAVPIRGGARTTPSHHSACRPTSRSSRPIPAQVCTAPLPFGLEAGESPRLVAFAVGCADIDATVTALRAAGWTGIDRPSVMSRVLPNGSELSWRLTTVGAPPMGPTPLLISWDGGTSS